MVEGRRERGGAAMSTGSPARYDVETVRKDFPILDRLVHGDHRLVSAS